MTIKVTGENAFSVPTHSFIIGQSAEGYALNYGVNGTDWTEYETPVDADTDCVVNFGIPNMFYKLVGNNSEVEIKW